MRRYPWSYRLFLCTGAGWLSVYFKVPFDMGNLPDGDAVSLIFAGVILVFALGGVALGPIVFMFEYASLRNKEQK